MTSFLPPYFTHSGHFFDFGVFFSTHTAISLNMRSVKERESERESHFICPRTG